MPPGLSSASRSLIDGHVARHVRQVGADRRAVAEDHVAGGALSLAEEELFAGRAVAGHGGFGRRCIERRNQGRERIEVAAGRSNAGMPAAGMPLG